MLKTIEFFVPGIPATAGSKRAMPIYRGKKGEKREFTGKSVVIDANPKGQREWMAYVRYACLAAYQGPLLDVAITMSCFFYFGRPKSHFGTGRNAQKLKDSAPLYHLQDPDRTKCLRAVEDALTGVIWVDDNRIVGGMITKEWTDGNPGAYIKIEYDDGEK